MKLPLHLLLPDVKGIPILMYHRVWEGTNDRLTITPQQLELHLAFLKDKGYRALSLGDFFAMANGRIPFDPYSFLLTFDDGYRNNLQLAYPLIKAMGFKATFFIIGNTLDGTAPTEENEVDQKMKPEELALLDPAIIQLALHSHNHIHFGNTALKDIQQDLQQNIAAFVQSGLPFYKVLAYPYGGRPKDKQEKEALQNWMQGSGIESAFRIGNKPCKVPAKDMYELKRIDVWGTDTVEELAIKLRKGKLKPF